MTTFTNNEAVLQKVAELQKEIGDQRAPKLDTVVKTVAETAGFKILLVNMAALGTGVRVPIMAEGYAVHVAKAGSDAIAVQMDFGRSGTFGPVYPGLSIRPAAKFSQIVVQRWNSITLPPAGGLTDASCFTLGAYLTLVISKVPDAVYEDQAAGPNGGFVHVRTGAQAYNSTANLPTLAADGMRADGARSMRVTVDVGNGNTLTAGTVVWWVAEPQLRTNGAIVWWETDVQQVLPTGRRYSACAELEVRTSGLFFPELRSVTHSGGSGAINYQMYTVGEGGELRPGDVAQ